MHFLFEAGDSLNTPFECFIFRSESEKFPVRPHWHYFVEVIYMLRGAARMQCGESSYVLHPGDVILFHPQAVHTIFSENGEPVIYSVLKFDVNRLNMTPAYAPKVRSILKSAENQGMPIYFHESELHCEKIFERCVQEIEEKKYGYDLLIQAYLYDLMLKMIRRWQELGFQIENESFHNDGEYRIDNITEYMDKHIKESLQVQDIAQKCGMSYSYFAKKFREMYGKSCKEYMEVMRIFKVEDYLLFTDFDLNYISQETGFSDCSHMIKTFKRYRGMTPKQYRMHYQNSGTSGK
ncbi:MAG: AraC family transcriptional regulator [Ruminococcus sp.]|nr:AraC family transcriptional regulator [Ruminococcus sp.]